ncbi:G1/S-specific cyclin-D2-like [Rhodnius prolixus]|uniref:G1/S-specific cyclin-D2-like n=1 Tax=Rhodnius prolixus TaxID=13249 RepID=UPI003D18E7E7
METLLCTEIMSSGVKCATVDPVIHNSKRVISNLLAQQVNSLPECDYFNTIQTEIKPFMRKVVTNWMLEVCEDQHCEMPVFPLAVNLLDRFLCSCKIKRSQLQLSGAACLLIASKTRQYFTLPVGLLCFYTDNSVTPDDLKQWELLIMTKLRWRIYGVTGADFIDHLLISCWPDSDNQIRNHAHTLLSLACTEPELMQTKSSTLASASLIAAARGLKIKMNVFDKLCDIIETCSEEEIELTVQKIEHAFLEACKAMTSVVQIEDRYIQSTTTQQSSTGYDVCFI